MWAAGADEARQGSGFVPDDKKMEWADGAEKGEIQRDGGQRERDRAPVSQTTPL